MTSPNNVRRHALVFPWAGLPPDQAVGKDLYLVPFTPNDPTPEFIELLDEVHLPKARTGNMLLGIFVLQKGRLSTTPPQPTTAPPPLLGVDEPTQPSLNAVNPVPSLEDLLPGGLTEQHKTLLQSLMASQAVTSSLAQSQTNGILPSQIPPQAGYSQHYAAPPPTQPFQGSITPYGGGHPAGTYPGYHSPPVEHPSYSSGPSSGPAYIHTGMPAHPARHISAMEDRRHQRSPSADRRQFSHDGSPRDRYEAGRGRRFSDDRVARSRGRGNFWGGDRSRGRDQGWSG